MNKAVTITAAFLVIVIIVLSIRSGNSELDEKLLAASRAGNYLETEKLLNGGASLNARDSLGQTALHAAAYNNMVDVADTLIKHGANIEAEDNRGATALHWAAVRGNVEVMSVLIKNGANLEARDDFDMTPLHWAASQGMVATVVDLLAAGADINARDTNGNSALKMAENRKYQQLIKILKK